MSDLQSRQSARKRSNGPYLSHHEMRQRNERLVAVYLDGLTSVEAARAVGVSKSQARRILRGYGVSRPVGRRRVAQ